MRLFAKFAPTAALAIRPGVINSINKPDEKQDELSAESARAHRPIGRVGSVRRLRDNTDLMNTQAARRNRFFLRQRPFSSTLRAFAS
jgi:hypothetical protein